MANTHFQDPGSSEIISTHISGLQESAKNIEIALGMQTAAETGVTLSEIYISDEDRYRILQAPEGKRCWVSSPAPVIKKNGSVITTGFDIEYSGGAIKLKTNALATDVFTADFTHITNTVSNMASVDETGNVPLSQLGNVPKVDLSLINKELANIEAVLDVDNRALQNNGKVYDLLDGTNNYSCGQLDTTNTSLTSAVSVGATTLPVKSTTGLSIGKEVTIFDDTNLERKVITAINGLNLTVSALTKAFKNQAVVCRSSATVDKTNKTMKFSGWAHNATFDRTTPIQLASGAYSTGGGLQPYQGVSSGRKIVRTSNGNIIASYLNSGTIYFVKSTDNGASFDVLCNISGSSYSAGYAVDCIGNVVKVIWTDGSKIYCNSFDVTTVTNTDQNANKVTIDTQTSAIYGCSLAIDGDGTLHAVWTSKNSTYPNSYNIRYSKSTDGGITWDSPTQLTTANNSNISNQSPYILITSDNKPLVVFSYQYTGTSYIIKSLRYTTSWQSEVNIYDGSAKAQYNPCAILDGNGNIHVVWDGTDSTDTSKNNIRYSKSTDGGATWTTSTKLTSGNSYEQGEPSIARDANNNLYVYFSGITSSSGGYRRIRKIVYSGGSWGSVTDVTTNTTADITTPQTCANYFNFTVPLCEYCDNVNTKVQFIANYTDTIATQVLVEDFRYNITPPLGTTDELFLCLYNEKDAGYSLSGALSIVDTNANENYVDMTKTTTSLGASTEENQFVGSVATAQEKVTFRGTATRTSTSIDKSITKVLGAIA